MTSEECIDILKNRLIALVNSGQLKATYNQSNSTISFYVNDISVEKRPLLTLRVSDHRPTYQNYIHTDLTPPSPEENTNVSIEFYKPKYNKKGKKIKDKVNSGVQVPQNVDDILPFVINSYKYTPELLEKADVEEIYNAILNWINGGLNAIYIDPFANTHKKAKVQTKIANIKWNISHNISVDNDGNYVSANGWGADYVSETRDIYNKNKRLNCNRNMKQTIRLTESKLRGMIQEAVNEALNEYGDTPLGQYNIGRAVARRKDMGMDPHAMADHFTKQHGTTYNNNNWANEFAFSNKAMEDGYNNQRQFDDAVLTNDDRGICAYKNKIGYNADKYNNQNPKKLKELERVRQQQLRNKFKLSNY